MTEYPGTAGKEFKIQLKKSDLGTHFGGIPVVERPWIDDDDKFLIDTVNRQIIVKDQIYFAVAFCGRSAVFKQYGPTDKVISAVCQQAISKLHHQIDKNVEELTSIFRIMQKKN